MLNICTQIYSTTHVPSSPTAQHDLFHHFSLTLLLSICLKLNHSSVAWWWWWGGTVKNRECHTMNQQGSTLTAKLLHTLIQTNAPYSSSSLSMWLCEPLFTAISNHTCKWPIVLKRVSTCMFSGMIANGHLLLPHNIGHVRFTCQTGPCPLCPAR